MKKVITIFLSLLAFFFFANNAFAQVVITEIMYDLPKDSGADGGREWIEVLNNGDEEVNLSDWRFFEADTNHKLKLFQGDDVLPIGEFAVIADNPEKFLVDNVGFSGTIFDSSFSLKNTGETIILRNADLVDIDSVTYNSDLGGKGDGNSLQKINDNWTSATPTPGTSNLGVQPPSEPQGENSSGGGDTETNEQSQLPPPVAASASSWPVEPQIFARIKDTPKIAVVGAGVLFAGEALGLEKKSLSGARYLWTFGDGGTKEGEKVLYYYNYPGKYVVILNASSGKYSASDRVIIEAIPADIEISAVGTGVDSFVEIYNKTKYELNLSWWRLRASEQLFTIPKDTIVLPNSKIIFPPQNTKFEITKNESIDMLYPNGNVATSYAWTSIPLAQVKAQTPKAPVSASVKISTPAKPKPVKDRPLQTRGTDGREKELPISSVVSEQQSANIFTATKDNENSIYKWLFAVAALAVISVLGVLFIGKMEPEAESISKEVDSSRRSYSEADEYEIVEEE